MCFEETSTQQVPLDAFVEGTGIAKVNKDVISYCCTIDGDIPKGWENLMNEIKMLEKQQPSSKVPNISHIPDDKIIDFSYPECSRIFSILKYAILKSSFPEHFKNSKLIFDNDNSGCFGDICIENFKNLSYLSLSVDEEGRHYLELNNDTKIYPETIGKKETISPFLAAKSLANNGEVLDTIPIADSVQRDKGEDKRYGE